MKIIRESGQTFDFSDFRVREYGMLGQKIAEKSGL
jgi:hypothetical protein